MSNHNITPDGQHDDDQTSWSTIHRLAANNDPGELITLAMDACTALMSHYQIAIERWQSELEGIVASECRCENCCESIIGLAENIARASAEKAKNVAAGNLLTTLDAEFPAAEPGEIEKFVAEMVPGEAQEAGE